LTRADVVVLGEALVDVFDGTDVPGGAPFNVARNLAALGAPPLMVTRVGMDPRGRRLVDGLRVLDMPLDGVQYDADRPTGAVDVTLRDGQPSFAIADDAAWDHLDTALAADATRRAQPRIACFGTLAQRTPASRAAIRACLAATDALRVLDLNLRGQAGERECAAESLLLADVVKVNEDELAQLLRWFAGDGSAAMPTGGESGDALDRARTSTLLRAFDLQRLVVTRGALGWACMSRDGQVLEGGAPPVAVVDTVGAGDAFTAVLLLGEVRGWATAATLAHAARFAATACTLRGAFEPGAPIYALARAGWAATG
jgi:fructokinase